MLLGCQECTTGARPRVFAARILLFNYKIQRCFKTKTGSRLSRRKRAVRNFTTKRQDGRADRGERDPCSEQAQRCSGWYQDSVRQGVRNFCREPQATGDEKETQKSRIRIDSGVKRRAVAARISRTSTRGSVKERYQRLHLGRSSAAPPRPGSAGLGGGRVMSDRCVRRRSLVMTIGWRPVRVDS